MDRLQAWIRARPELVDLFIVAFAASHRQTVDHVRDLLADPEEG